MWIILLIFLPIDKADKWRKIVVNRTDPASVEITHRTLTQTTGCAAAQANQIIAYRAPGGSFTGVFNYPRKVAMVGLCICGVILGPGEEMCSECTARAEKLRALLEPIYKSEFPYDDYHFQATIKRYRRKFFGAFRRIENGNSSSR